MHELRDAKISLHNIQEKEIQSSISHSLESAFLASSISTNAVSPCKQMRMSVLSADGHNQASKVGATTCAGAGVAACSPQCPRPHARTPMQRTAACVPRAAHSFWQRLSECGVANRQQRRMLRVVPPPPPPRPLRRP